MRVILKISALLLMCMLIYKCQKTEYVAEFEDDDPDEIGWIGEDLTGEELDTRASTFKIHQVVATDSLPEFQVTNPAKKQKFGKRQIVSTTAKTRFWIRGIGFRVRTDSSNVKCYIKTVEQAGIEIVSWDSNQVVVDFPILTSQLLIDNTFSIQFKIFRKNDNPLKANISRSRSRGCISRKKADAAIGIVQSDTTTCYRPEMYYLMQKRTEVGYTNTPSESIQNIDANYRPEPGDIIFRNGNNTTQEMGYVSYYHDEVKNQRQYTMHTMVISNNPCRVQFFSSQIYLFNVYPYVRMSINYELPISHPYYEFYLKYRR